ncbi:MAG: hypothetical protein HUU32_13210 [Calditrichaceae bacterium]|nr:site-specific DNA-methyltransferase [Calditrichia bacterium]NUQ42346.1 hypothetical protein [Calditrichaceae bacterium]
MIETQYAFEKMLEAYSRNKTPILLDFKKASAELINNNLPQKDRQIHYFHYYPGRIFPYIPLYILSLEEISHLKGPVLDPFAGSGTVLLESLINPIIKRNALGVEINPLARLISKVKTTPLDVIKVLSLLDNLHSLFSQYSQTANLNSHVPDFKNINLWFSSHAITQLSKLKWAIENLEASTQYRDFFLVAFSSIIRKVSKADPNIPPPVVLKPQKYKNNPRTYEKLQKFLEQAENPSVWQLFANVLKNNLTRIDGLNGFKEIKNGSITAKIIYDDARHIKHGQLLEGGRINKEFATELASSSIEVILTSPPYLTAQKYIRTNRLELFWLGYTEEEIQNLDKQSIGTERVSSVDVYLLGIESIDILIDRTYSKSKERGITIFAYFENMLKVFKEMYRVLKDGGYAFIVVGNNEVLGEKVDTHRLLTDAALGIGFTEIAIFKDEIKTRSMMRTRNGTGGLIKDEYVIILKKEG